MKKMLVTLMVLGLSCIGGYAQNNILVCSGAGLIKPMNEIIKNFENKNNILIDIHYGGSGELFSVLQTTGCDVFVPGATFYTEKAVEKNLLEKNSVKTITQHIPTFVVQKGNPKGIYSLSDLSKSDLKIAMGDPKAVPIGKVAVKMLKNNKSFDSAKKNIITYAGTVNQLLIYMAMGQADVAIIWEDMVTWAKEKGKLDVITIPKNENIIKTIPNGVGSMSTNKDAASMFNDYLVSDEAKEIWTKWGFKL